jgi:rubrerythrin
VAQNDDRSGSGTTDAESPNGQHQHGHHGDTREIDIQILTVLARMDLEAAASYQVAAEAAADQPDVRERLMIFADEHMRHVESLDRLIRARGGETVAREEQLENPLLPQLAMLAGPLGAGYAVSTMLAQEHVTVGSYEAVLEFEWDEDALAVLGRHFADEQRHLSWLADKEDELTERDDFFEDLPSPPV